uniref:Uncharacterized protein n=1 Tax=Arundo donax TaxID=35708 RepID=A0A0A8YUR0_ARUDO
MYRDGIRGHGISRLRGSKCQNRSHEKMKQHNKRKINL